MSGSVTACRSPPWCHDLMYASTDSHYITRGKNTGIVILDQTHLAGILLQRPTQKTAAVKWRKSSSKPLGSGLPTWEFSASSHCSEYSLCSKTWRTVCPQRCFYFPLIPKCKPLFHTEVSKPDLEMRPVRIHTTHFHQVTCALPTSHSFRPTSTCSPLIFWNNSGTYSNALGIFSAPFYKTKQSRTTAVRGNV